MERDRAVADALSILAARKNGGRTKAKLHLVDPEEPPAGPPGTPPDGSGCAMDVRWTASGDPEGASSHSKSPGQTGGDEGTRTPDPLRAKQVL